MKAELKSLEEKIFKLVTMYQEIYQENSKLRKELEDSQAQNHKLSEKITSATHRLEKLLSNISDHES